MGVSERRYLMYEDEEEAKISDCRDNPQYAVLTNYDQVKKMKKSNNARSDADKLTHGQAFRDVCRQKV